MIADSSFSIMVNHALGIMVIKGIFAICKKAFGIFDTFDINSFKTNIAYMYCPRGVEHFLIFYVAAGIAVAVLLQQIVNWIKGKILSKAAK